MEEGNCSITVRKTSAIGGDLPGAQFELILPSGGSMYAVSDESGIARFNRITETSTVPGYILHTEPVFAGSLVDYGNAELSLTVCNCPNITMPFTGGEGFNYIYIITGLMSIMGLIIFKRRNANEEN